MNESKQSPVLSEPENESVDPSAAASLKLPVQEIILSNNKSTGVAKSQSKHVPTFEDILEASGGFGLFQYLVLIALLAPEIPAAFVAFAPVFTGKTPTTWYCMESDNATEGYEVLENENICDCPGLLFSEESSIVSEWNLVCGGEWVSDFITSVQMLGMVAGSLSASQISDWYGRKMVYLGVCFLMCAGQLISAFAPNAIVYAIARFIGGAGISGFMGMSIIYSMEFLTPDYRLLTGSLSPWGEGIMIFALLGYYFREWRQLLWVSAIPFILPFITIPFIPESPRWLIRNKRFDEALAAVKKIQSVNGRKDIEVTKEMLEEIGRQESGQTADQADSTKIARFSYLDFFRESTLRKKTILLMGIWFAYSLVYFGISYNIKNMRGDPFWNVCFMGLSDAVGYPAALLINNRLGRRKSLIIFMIIGAIFLVTLSVVDLMYGAMLSATLVVSLCLTGKFGVAGARSAARILTSESFPTAIRTMGYGITGVFAGLGGIIAPQIVLLGSLWWRPLPFLTFGVISIAGSLLSLLLPETAGKTLQEQMGPQTQKNIKIAEESTKTKPSPA